MPPALKEVVTAKRTPIEATPPGQSKLADAAVSPSGLVVPPGSPEAQGPAPATLSDADRIAALEADKASLQAQLRLFTAAAPVQTNKAPATFGTQPLKASDPTAHAQASPPDARLAIGADIDEDTGAITPRLMPEPPGDSRRLFLVELPGHKTRVVDPTRGVALMLREQPVWARNAGEARMIFDSWNGICATVQQYRIVLAVAA